MKWEGGPQEEGGGSLGAIKGGENTI